MGKCGVERNRFGSLECLKYNSVDFCLNSQWTPRLTTEMNNSKTPCIQQIRSNARREKGHKAKSYRKQDNLIKKSFCPLNKR